MSKRYCVVRMTPSRTSEGRRYMRRSGWGMGFSTLKEAQDFIHAKIREDRQAELKQKVSYTVEEVEV